MVNRRGFLKGVGMAAGSVAVAPQVITSDALGAEGKPPASDRIVLSHVGMGWFGTVDLQTFLTSKEVQNVAVCDVDAEKLAAAKARVNGQYGNQDCKGYRDFREMLDRADIDAVSIATPDHWHALPTVYAAKRGKDVHIEKPLSLTIRQGRAMVDAVRRYGRVCQTGSEARSNPNLRFTCELVRSGRIGRVREVFIGPMVSGPPNDVVLPGQPVPPELDWDTWLGPAPWRPYHKAYHPVSWRAFRDFSGGGLTDWGAHHLDLVQWALGMDDSGPVEVCPPDGKDHPWLTWRYANGVMMYHVSTNEGVQELNLLGGGGVTMVGTEGKIAFSYGGLQKTEPAWLVHDVIGANDVHLHRCPPGGHECGDFVTSIRTRQRPGADVEIGHRSVSVAHLGNIAHQMRRPLKWDPVKEEFPGDAEANRLLDRAMRSPWAL